MPRLQLTSPNKTLWIVYLAVALVFIQGVRLHIHTYDHDSSMPGHVHQENVHSDYFTLEEQHSDEVAQIDWSQQARPGKLPPGSLVIALFVAVVMFLPLRLCTRIPWRRHRGGPLVAWPVSLRPPLRAPPL